MLHERGASHSVYVHWGRDGEFLGWYVNLEDPWRETALGFDTTDHLLDVWIDPDRTWRWKDEDHLGGSGRDRALHTGEGRRNPERRQPRDRAHRGVDPAVQRGVGEVEAGRGLAAAPDPRRLGRTRADLAPELHLVPRRHGRELEQGSVAARVAVGELALAVVPVDLEHPLLHAVVEPGAAEDQLA